MVVVCSERDDLAAIASLEKKIATRKAKVTAKKLAAFWSQFDLAVEHEYLRGPELARWLDDGGRS